MKTEQQRAKARQAVARHLLSRGLFRAALFNTEKAVQHIERARSQKMRSFLDGDHELPA